jgi:hypothetical protein
MGRRIVGQKNNVSEDPATSVFIIHSSILMMKIIDFSETLVYFMKLHGRQQILVTAVGIHMIYFLFKQNFFNFPYFSIIMAPEPI